MNLQRILDQAKDMRIAVVGDFIFDKYIIGDVERISPEAPVPIVKVLSKTESTGGAGNVASNLFNLGVNISCFYGENRPIKTRVMSGNHHMLRIDEEDINEWMRYDDYDIGLDYGIINSKFDCVVISDYGKGAISDEVAETIITKCKNVGIPVVVDTKTDITKFAGATVLKCNKSEWVKEKIVHNINKAEDINDVLNVRHFIITCGSHGMSMYFEGQGEGIGGYPVDVCDPCGAGDTVTAILAIHQCFKSKESKALEYRNMYFACELANIAASEVCRHPGVVAITKELLIKRYSEVYGSK